MISRVEEAAKSYAAAATSCGILDKEEGEKREGEKREGEKEKEKERKLNKRKEKEKREVGVKEKNEEEERKERDKDKENASSKEKQIPLSKNICKSQEIVVDSSSFTDSQLTESQRKILFLASEMKRISDPFLVFDSDGMEVQDPPDYYSADCLGKFISFRNSFSYV